MANQACFPVTTEQTEDGRIVQTLNQITKVRLSTGREVAIVDWTWRPLFSTIDTLSGWTDLELRAFVYSQGDPITVSSNMTVREEASLMHTNIKVPAEMDSQEELIVYSIQIEVFRMREDTAGGEIDVGGDALEPLPNPNDLALLHQATIGELEVSEKDYQVAGLGWFSPGFGVVPYMATGEDASFTAAGNSAPSRDAVDQFPVPVHIGSTEKYSFILHNPEGRAITYRAMSDGSAVATRVNRLRVYLHGLHKRPTG